MLSRALLWFVVLAAATSPAFAGRRDWIGSATCGTCHPAELASWQASRHAVTADRFPRPGAPPGRCLGCHSTGEAPAGPVIAVEVGCEACHGAGAAYAELDIMSNRPVAHALGLADLSTPKARNALCMQCHARGIRGTPIDPAAPAHPVPTKPRF